MDGEDREVISEVLINMLGNSVSEETLNLVYSLVIKNTENS